MLKFPLPFSPKGWSKVLNVENAMEIFQLALVMHNSVLSLTRLTSIPFYLIQINRRCKLNVFVPMYKLRSAESQWA